MELRGFVRFKGLPVPGAAVTAVQGGTRHVTITDPQGNYSIAGLPEGIWSVQVEMLCFSTITRAVDLSAGSTGVDWELKLLPLSEIKEVTNIETQAMSTAQDGGEQRDETGNPVRPGRKISRDPGPKRSPREPGSTPEGFKRTDLNPSNAGIPTAGASPENDSGAFGGQSPEDLAQRATEGLLINGSANNSASSVFGLFPAFGNARKGPGSLYNGGLGMILDNSVLDARPFSLTGQSTDKVAYNRFTGVASFGGPIRIPHLVKNGPVLVVNYQRTRNRNATNQSALMPTQAERGGDLSQARNVQDQPLTIFDPATGRQFPGNRIPQSRISPQAKALLDFYPMPNFTGGGRYNFQSPLVTSMHQDSLQSRLNKSLNRNNQIWGAFGFQSTRSDNPNLFGFLDTTDSTGLNSNINWRHNFSPRFLVSLGYQYSRLVVRTTPFFENLRNVSGDAGITGNNQEPVNWGPPELVFSGGTATLSDDRPAYNRSQTSAVSTGLFWNRGGHNLSFGFDVRRQQNNYLSQQDPRGTFTFTGAATRVSVNGVPVSGTGSDFADFLLGVPDASSIAYGNADKYFRSSSYDVFFKDDWRISPGLTLNAGIRWEYRSPDTEIYGRLVNLDIQPGFAAETPVIASHPVGALTGRTYPASLIRPDRLGIQPRLGVSWRPFPASSMVIRAGYGIYRNTSVYTTIASQMAQQAPLSKSLSVQNSPENPLTLADGFNSPPASDANTFAVDPDFRVGYAQTWQLSIQQDLPGAFVMIATYIGTKGTRAVQQFLPNTYPAAAIDPCPSCAAGYAYLASNGNSSREAGHIQLRRRLHDGFTATAQYAWSKSIDNAALGGRGQGGAVIAQNWLDLGAERGPSNFDQRHLLNLQLQYTSGMGAGSLAGGRMRTLLKEWTVSAQLTAGSGFPLTPVILAAVSGTGVTGSIRPDFTGVSVYAAPSGRFLNPASYAAPAPGHWGNAGRNSITGPVQFELNGSIGRIFRLRDRVSVDLRVDCANVLNHVTYPNWNSTANSAQFGLPTTANPMRTLQTTLRARF